MMVTEELDKEHGASQPAAEEGTSMVTLHRLCGQIAEIEARSAQVHAEMTQADARGARKEVLVLFKELCNLILLGAQVEAEMARLLLTAEVQLND